VAELSAHPTPNVATITAPPSITVVEVAGAYWTFAQGYYRKKDGDRSTRPRSLTG
jgi:hypothetical protein